MEIRKIIIELHPNGRVTWVEYTEPSSKEDRNYLCSRAYQKVEKDLHTYPASLWPVEVKASYLNGASRMMDILRKAL